MTETALIDRLRSASLRPTFTRICILQFITAPKAGAVSAEDVFRLATFRGRCVSLSTVYRTIHELEASGLLLREWGPNRKALYRMRPAGFGAEPLRLVCRESGRCVALTDADLHAHLLAAARTQGFDLRGKVLDIAVDRLTRTAPTPQGHAPPSRPRTRASRVSSSGAGGTSASPVPSSA